jgi:predicted histone-like DNA-binding protein
MIDYSVYMQPNHMDETAAPKAYAKAQMRELMTFDKFINHIASHNGGFSRGMVKGIVSDTCSCIVEQLLEGKKVQFGELGDFWISLTSTGAESMEAFTAANITGVNIIFTPGVDFANLIKDAEFNVVASRVAQAATLKTEKAGGTTVDLAAAKAAARANSGSNSNSTDSGNNSSGNSESGNSGSTENTNPTNPTNGGDEEIPGEGGNG